MTISVSDTLVPGGSTFGIIKASDQVGGYAAETSETTIGALASGKLVVNGTWRLSLYSGVTYLLTSPTPGGGFANGTWTPVTVPTTSGSWSPGATTVTTANDTLSGLAARNGYTPVAGDRVLVAAQTSQSANGIYVAASGAWSRASDANSAGAFILGKSISITGGTSAGAIYICTQVPTTLGTDPINFVVNSTGASVNWAAPGALGATTPNTVNATKTTLTPPDGGTSGTTYSFCDNEVALSTNSATNLLTTAISVATGNQISLDVIINISRDASTDAGRWKRTINVRNNSGTITTVTGGTTDTDLSEVNNLSSGISTATSAIVISGTTLQVQCTRPTGVACHARVTLAVVGVTVPAA